MRRRGCHIFRTIGLQMTVRLTSLHAGRALPHNKEDTWFVFSLENEETPGHSAAGRIK